MTYLYHICCPQDEGNLCKGYLGITDDPFKRIKRHFAGYGNIVIKRALEKYGELSFSLVSEGSREEMLRLENYFRPTKKAWNLVAGGGNPPNLKGKKWNKIQAIAIPLANSGKNNSKWKGWWSINGHLYESMSIASKALGVSKPTVRNRCLSKAWPEWIFVPDNREGKK